MTVAQRYSFEADSSALPPAVADATFSVRIDLRVKDMLALWMEALHVGLGQNASKLTDVTRVIDMIGTQVDPSVADCIAMLIDPSRFPGCRITHVDMTEGYEATTRGQSPQLCLV